MIINPAAFLPRTWTAQAPAAPSGDMIGWATQNGGTTGAGMDPADEVTVSTLTGFLDAVTTDDAAKIVKFSVLLDFTGFDTGSHSGMGSSMRINVASNKTILGVGSTAEIRGCGLSVSDPTTNVIIRNIKCSETSELSSGTIRLSGTSNVWVDHCTILQGPDGGIDCTNGTDYVTISWCHFIDTLKTCLVGSNDTDFGEYRITYHHNFFDDVKERCPRVRHGNPHVFNCYFEDVNKGITPGFESAIRSENNCFVRTAYPYFLQDDGSGHLLDSGSIVDGTPWDPPVSSSNVTTVIPYAYTLNNAADLPPLVTAGAGVGKI